MNLWDELALLDVSNMLMASGGGLLHVHLLMARHLGWCNISAGYDSTAQFAEIKLLGCNLLATLK